MEITVLPLRSANMDDWQVRMQNSLRQQYARVLPMDVLPGPYTPLAPMLLSQFKMRTQTPTQG